MAFCMYLRKSRTDYEAEQYSNVDTLSRHYDTLSDLAAKNRHLIGHVYREVVSGDTITDRPQVQQMIADIIAGKWEGVYVTEIERLARGDTSDQGYIQRVFQISGALIITPGRIYDPANPYDEESVEFSLFLARREYKTINRRQQAGRHRSLEEGKFISSRAAYGYRKYKLPDQRGYSLSICEEEAAVLRQIADWYLNGMDGQPMGLTAIATRLTVTGVPPGQNAKVWSASRLYNIFRNPVYIGKIRWGYEKMERSLSLAGVEKRRVIHNDCQQFDGIHPAIWSVETFEAIQSKLHGYQGHLPVRKGAALSNPLAGLVFCSECGHVMSHLPACGRQPAILKCRTRGCPTVQIYREHVENSVLSSLRSWLADAGSVASPQEEKPAAESALDSMHAERRKILSQIDRVQDLLEQDVYTVEQYAQRFSKLNDRLCTLDASIAAETQRIAAQPVYATPAELAPAIVHLLETYDDSTPQQKNDMLRTCISSIVYHKTEKSIVIPSHSYSNVADFSVDVFPLIKSE